MSSLTPESVQSAVKVLSPDWLRAQRWFASKSRQLTSLSVFDQVPLSESPPVALVLLEAHYKQGPDELYSLPLLLEGTQPQDALDCVDCQRQLIRLMDEAAVCGPVHFEPYLPLGEPGEPKRLAVEQSNTSIAYDRKWILKWFRKVGFGESRDLEVGRFLTAAAFSHTPPVAGAAAYEGVQKATLGVLQAFVENEGDGWSYVLNQLSSLAQEVPNAPDDVFWADAGLPDRERPLLMDVAELGRVTGQLHRALGSRTDVDAFAPEPVTPDDAAAWHVDLVALRRRALAAAQAQKARLNAEALAMLAEVKAHRAGLPALPAAGLRKIQIHGDFHLGNVLKTRDGFTIIDFEGEPARPLDERRAKQPPLRDVAGMLRSLHYAAFTSPLPAVAASDWYRNASDAFVQGWLEGSHREFVSGSDEGTRELLGFFQLAKAYYELAYELNNRPDWAPVPLRGIVSLIADA